METIEHIKFMILISKRIHKAHLSIKKGKYHLQIIIKKYIKKQLKICASHYYCIINVRELLMEKKLL